MRVDATVLVMSDTPRYHVRRGQRERIVDVVAVDRAPSVPASRHDAGRRLAQGSHPALTPPPPPDDELAALAPPATPGFTPRTMQFGGTTVVIEVDGRGVSLVLPGALRLTGSAAEALILASELLRPR